MNRRSSLLYCLWIIVLLISTTNPALPTTRKSMYHSASSAATAGKGSGLDLPFEPNVGQTDQQARFLARTASSTVFLQQQGLVLRFTRVSERTALSSAWPGLESAVLGMEFAGARPDSELVGETRLPGRSHYFQGSDPSRWRTNVPHYSRVRYPNLYPGVDLVFYGVEGNLEYDFVLSPGADPNQIAVRLSGADSLTLDDNGDLIIKTSVGPVRQKAPYVYQPSDNGQRRIAGRFVLGDETVVSFAVGPYDRELPLIIDPVIVYSTYLGGSGSDQTRDVAVMGDGSVILAGNTTSVNFPLANPLQGTKTSGSRSTFVSKIDPTGTQLIYSTYLGGSGDDPGFHLAVDPEGNVYLVGATTSADFPIVNGFQSNLAGGNDAFLAKLSSGGDTLLYSTYLGGSGFDNGGGVAADASGNVWALGMTFSDDFPTKNALQGSRGGLSDGFVARLDSNLAGPASLIFSTYLGGSGNDMGSGTSVVVGITVDGSQNAYLAGITGSADFPTMNPLQATFGGVNDAVVAKINPAGALVYSTYLGGNDEDSSFGVAVDSGGSAYIVGVTLSEDFPTTSIQDALAGGPDAFIAKLDPSGSSLTYSTYLGGTGDESAQRVALDADNRAIVGGNTASDDFPLVNPTQPNRGGGASDGWVATLNAAGEALDFSTFLGGSANDVVLGLQVDPAGQIYAAGNTASSDFPVTDPVLQMASGGGDDIFLTKIDQQLSLPINLYFAQFGNGAVGDITLRSDIVLANASATDTATGRVDFFEADGSPFATGVEGSGTLSSVAFSVTPLGSTTVSTTGQGEFGTGTAVVSSDRPLGGVIRFNISAPAGVGSGIAGVPVSQVVSGFVTPVRRVAGGINTGVAIRNVGSTPVNLTLSLRGENGVEVPLGSAARAIVGNGQLVDFINNLFPDADTDDLVGSLVVTSDGMIAATAIEQGTQPGQFTTLPVTPLQ